MRNFDFLGPWDRGISVSLDYLYSSQDGHMTRFIFQETDAQSILSYGVVTLSESPTTPAWMAAGVSQMVLPCSFLLTISDPQLPQCGPWAKTTCGHFFLSLFIKNHPINSSVLAAGPESLSVCLDIKTFYMAFYGQDSVTSVVAYQAELARNPAAT